MTTSATNASMRAHREAIVNAHIEAEAVHHIAAHYTDDAILIVPGTPSTVGRDAIRNALKPMTADSALSLKFHASRVEVAKSGDLAYAQGSYTLDATDPQSKQAIHDHGSYVTTYRKLADG